MLRYQTRLPLLGLEFAIAVETKLPKKDIVHKIQMMGGKISDVVHQKIAAIISNGDKIEPFEGDMKWALDRGILLIPEEFLNEVMDNDPIEVMLNMDMCNRQSSQYANVRILY